MLDSLSKIFDPNSPLLISMPIVFVAFQFLFLIAFALYVIYAFVIIRQTTLMARTVLAPLEKPLMLLAWGHFIASLIVWIVAFIARV